jgi:hypothetical protein
VSIESFLQFPSIYWSFFNIFEFMNGFLLSKSSKINCINKNWLIYLSLDYDISQSLLKFFFANSFDLVILNFTMLSKNYERILCYLSVISTFLRSDYHSLILKNANLSNYPYERSHSNRNVNLFLYFLFASFKNNCTLKN